MKTPSQINNSVNHVFFGINPEQGNITIIYRNNKNLYQLYKQNVWDNCDQEQLRKT